MYNSHEDKVQNQNKKLDGIDVSDAEPQVVVMIYAAAVLLIQDDYKLVKCQASA